MTVGKLIKKYGMPIKVVDEAGGNISVCFGFIQPLRYKNKMYLDGVNTQIGFNMQGHYLYLGQPDCDITKNSESTVLEYDGIKYQIDRAEKVMTKTETIYIWAVIRKIIEVDYDG